MAAPVAFSTVSIIRAMRVLGFFTATFTMLWNMNLRGGVSWHGEASFNLHPILMVLGFLLPAGEGVLAYKGGLNGSKRYVRTGHLILNTVALILGTLGVAAAFKYQFEKKADHMYSIHSWLGLATIFLFAFQWLVGYVTFWYPGASEAKKAVVRPWLGFLSRFVCLLGLATAETGLIERANYLVNANELEHYSLEATLINVVGALMPLLMSWRCRANVLACVYYLSFNIHIPTTFEDIKTGITHRLHVNSATHNQVP